jgi:hypothetical protein
MGSGGSAQDRGVYNLIKDIVAYDNQSYHPAASAYDRRHECAQAVRGYAEGPYSQLQAVCCVSETMPDTAILEDIRRFQLHLAETGMSICNRNRHHDRRFLFRVTLRRLDLAAEIYHIREPEKILQVMSPDEMQCWGVIGLFVPHSPTISTWCPNQMGAGRYASNVREDTLTDSRCVFPEYYGTKVMQQRVIFLYPPHSFIILFNFSVVSLIVHPVHKDLCSQVDESGVTV